MERGGVELIGGKELDRSRPKKVGDFFKGPMCHGNKKEREKVTVLFSTENAYGESSAYFGGTLTPKVESMKEPERVLSQKL